ncbi:MAG TPA: DUF4479 domain-containing protein [Bacillota bacterium]|nr:DUF4479 domain-containing protein [Bacillota bacterium]
MEVYYNPNGIGDVLIIPIKDGKQANITYKTYGPVTKIIDQENVIGYNIFDASKHLDFEQTGKIILTKELLNQLKQLFKIHQIDDPLDLDISPKFVVGHVLKKERHANADKLSVCQVDVGDETLQIVCGAANVDSNQRVVVAKSGATMPSGMKIKPTTLRGVRSNGMICSKKELGLPNGEKETGIYVLDHTFEPGQPFVF